MSRSHLTSGLDLLAVSASAAMYGFGRLHLVAAVGQLIMSSLFFF
jgi:hypothetical protein